ncbi:hypothetical protein GGI42DRAFT_118497 [Trichoderma sp. SZMC 28013]
MLYSYSNAVLVLWLFSGCPHRIASRAPLRRFAGSLVLVLVLGPSTGACKDLDGMHIHGLCSRQSPRRQRAQPMTLPSIGSCLAVAHAKIPRLPDNDELLVARRALHQSINPSLNQSSHTGWECVSRARACTYSTEQFVTDDAGPRQDLPINEADDGMLLHLATREV